MSKVLVTGATGFVGRHLCSLLIERGYEVVGTSRSGADDPLARRSELRMIGDIGDDVEWSPILEGVDYVVHLAARVHVMQDTESDPLTEFRRVNVEGTKQLLNDRQMLNVKRLIYLSTVKVHGESTVERPFRITDEPSPIDPYAQSKLEAEQFVRTIGSKVGFETVIIRPPLVYGPGVGGNFLRLIGMVKRGIPLPFGRIDNRRSLVGVRNLCDLICGCLMNPSAAGKRFLVSDNADISTRALISMIASSMSRPVRLLPVPPLLLSTVARAAGRSAELSRLTGSLRVDVDETMRTLDWTPPISLADGIDATVKWYELRSANG
jgi:nucleoside-diphosphate-sugar epimerase